VVFRSSDKIEKIKEIKQNGETASSVMTDFIRQADAIDCTEVLDGRLGVEMGGETTVFECDAEERIASSGAYLTSSEISCADITFTCDTGGGNTSLVSFSFTLSLDSYSSDFSGKVLLLTQ